MSLFEHFPYTNFHDLNLDWLLRHVKSLRDRLEELIKDYERTKVPAGGKTGQVLTKQTDDDYIMYWHDSAGLPDGGNTGDLLTKTADGAAWAADRNVKLSGSTLDDAAELELVNGSDTVTIGGSEIMATGDKFQFSGNFKFTAPVEGVTPTADTDLTTKQYVDGVADSIDGLPAGGTTGQVVTKTETGAAWADPSGGGGDYLPLAGGTMDGTALIKWYSGMQIGIDSSGYDTANFGGANVIGHRFMSQNGNSVIYYNPDGMDAIGVSAYNIGASFPDWTFRNSVFCTKSPTLNTHIANKRYVDLHGVPDGGTTGQVLAKASDKDRDLTWADAPTPDIPNLTGAFGYQLPYIATGTRTDISGIVDKLTSFFKTSYGIMTVALNSPDLTGGMTAGAKYCLGIPASVYVPLGATTKIPLYGMSDGSVKQVALLEFEVGGKAYITLLNSIETAAALTAYLSITDFKVNKWYNG